MRARERSITKNTKLAIDQSTIGLRFTLLVVLHVLSRICINNTRALFEEACEWHVILPSVHHVLTESMYACMRVCSM